MNIKYVIRLLLEYRSTPKRTVRRSSISALNFDYTKLFQNKGKASQNPSINNIYVSYKKNKLLYMSM